MTDGTIDVVVETTDRKSFASALEWPGWSRSGRSTEAAVETLLGYAQRYEIVARAAGLAFPEGALTAEVVEEIAGDASTAYGVPSRIADRDRRAVSAREAEQLASVVEAAWVRFDEVARHAPEELRKGPRGGGRDTSKVVEHVLAADHGYARELGVRLPPPDPTDTKGIADLRAAMLEVLREPSDGSPIVKRWTPRYAARRIAWHALDHAWEIEDRSEPTD